MKKRLLCILLSMLLLVTLLPQSLFTVTVEAEENHYQTKNVEVSEGWDYIEVATVQEFKDACCKHVWWENNENPTSTFVRLTADIELDDSSVTKNDFALIYLAISSSLTIDFNGHSITGKIRAFNNQDNKTWSLLNVNMFYGCVENLTLRFVDSVGGGGLYLDAETYVDGPANALCVHSTSLLYDQDDSFCTEQRKAWEKDGAHVVIDGGSFELKSKNQKFATSHLSAYVDFVDSEKNPCWNSNTPYTRSAVGITGCKTVINNGHLTATNNTDDKAGQLGNRYVSALGLGNDYAVAGLRINGGTFDGSAYAVFFDNNFDTARNLPVLNGGSFTGGIMFCSTASSWWNKTQGVYEMDNTSKNWSISKILTAGSILYLDGTRADNENTTLETISLPHTIRIEPAPEISINVSETNLFTGQNAIISYTFSKTPESLTVQELQTTYRNGRQIAYWGECKNAFFAIYNGVYKVEIPGKQKAGTGKYRVVADYSYCQITSEETEFEWVKKPDYGFLVQPVSRTSLVGDTVTIPFDYSEKQDLLYWNLVWLKDGAYWENSVKFSQSQTLEGLPQVAITGPDDSEAEVMTYMLQLVYESDGMKSTVDSKEFTITWHTDPAYQENCQHEWVLQGNVEPTFLEKGYSGDQVCIKCGKVLEGEIIPKLNYDSYLSIANLTPNSEDPIICHIGDEITVSFDAIISKDLPEGYQYTVACGYSFQQQYYKGTVDENLHASVTIPIQVLGTRYWNGYIYLEDAENHVVGEATAQLVFQAVEGTTCKHEYVLTSDTATCSSNGTKYYQCSICGASKSEDSPATGAHVYGSTYISEKDSCYKVCLQCGEKTDVQAHHYTVTKTSPVNCTEADVTSKCTRCGCSKTERKGGYNYHDYNVNFGTYYDATYHWWYCTVCGEAKKEAHVFGEYSDYCEVCYYSKGETINASKNGDSYLQLPSVSCVHGTLSVDSSHVAAELLQGSTFYWYAYTSNGLLDLGTGTTINLAKLSASQKNLLTGRWVHVDLKRDNQTLLNAEVIMCPSSEVAGVDADCIHTGVIEHLHCTCCGADCDSNFNIIDPVIPATGLHIYDNECDDSCNVCGTLRSVQHAFNSAWECDSTGHYHVCTSCGAKGDYAAHEATEWITDAEACCASTGKMHLECKVCGQVLASEITPAAHTYEKTSTPATCTEDGLLSWVCLSCGDTVSVAVPALGHQIVSFAEKPANCVAEGVKAHFGCQICGTAFSDKEGTTVLSADSLALPKDPSNHYGLFYYGSNADTHWAICKCGTALTAHEAHTFVDNICTVCKLTTTEASAKDAELAQESANLLRLMLYIVPALLLILLIVVVIILITKKKRKAVESKPTEEKSDKVE